MRNVKTKILNKIWDLLEIKLNITVNKNVETELANDVREKLLITYPQLNHITKENLKL
jgi:hypothetical protein